MDKLISEKTKVINDTIHYVTEDFIVIFWDHIESIYESV